jgi:lysozyme
VPDRPTRGPAVAAALCALVAGLEGTRQVAYQDVVGVWTICDGETEGVHEGDRVSLAECRAKLTKRLGEFGDAIEQCAPGLPNARFIALTSFAYNVGSHAACSSSAVKLINAGHVQEGCDALMKWNKAGGITFPGLTKRRAIERDLCLQDPSR